MAEATRRPLFIALLLGLASATQSAPSAAQSNGSNQSWSALAASTWLARARRHVAQGDTFAAIRDYTEALRIDPDSGAACLELAAIRGALGDYRDAVWLLNRASALPETRGEALSRRAELHLGMGKRELALADLRAAVESAPTAEHLRALAAFYVQEKAWVAALAAWRRLEVTMNPSDASARSEAREMVAALGALAAEADGVQHDMRERSWVRRALRRHALPTFGDRRPPGARVR
jgi:tetratricopeptide (TPR) repeat protein